MNIFIIFPNQLFEQTLSHVLEQQQHPYHIYLIEEPLFFHRKGIIKPNKIKIAYMRACMKWYYTDYLKKNGVKNVTYIDFKTALGTNPFQNLKYKKIFCYDVNDHDLEQKLFKMFGKQNITFLVSPNFLISLSDFLNQKQTTSHAAFYEFSKSKLMGDVMKGVKNQDKLNRQPPPPSHSPQHPHIQHHHQNPRLKKYYSEARDYAKRVFPSHIGDADELGIYPITHEDAYASLSIFLGNTFKDFGRYQDAIMQNDPFMFHTVISPMLNIGLLDPKRVLSMILEGAKQNDIPLNSVEGLIRQIIGWREYMRYLYRFHYKEMIKANAPNNIRVFKSNAFYDGSTGVYPLDNEIKKAVKYGYAHHIVRLMVFMNFFILCEINPDQIYRWFMEVVAIDAYDWVMVSNIYAMGYFYTKAMRRPYISTSNYILKMSDYKKDGQWDTLWTGLFHRFISIKPDGYVRFYKRNIQKKGIVNDVQTFLDYHTK